MSGKFSNDLFRVNIDATEFQKTELKLGKYYKKAPDVLSRTLNRAAESARTTAVKSATEIYWVKAKDVRGTIKLIKAIRSRLGALVISKDNKMPLDKFKVTPAKPRPKNPPAGGLRVAVQKTGLKQLLHAFVADVYGPKVFERRGKSRLPIDRLMGPAIPQLIGGQKIRPQVEKESFLTFQKRLDHEIKRVLEGNG